MGFSQQEYWNGLPFPPPVDHILSEFFTMTSASCVALHGMTYSFIELCKPLHHNKVVILEGKAMTSLDNILKSKDFTLLTKVHIVVHLSVMSEFLQPHGHARLPHHSPFPFAQINVHWVTDAIQPSCPLSSPSPPAFSLFQHQGLCIRWSKYWSFTFSISPSHEYSGLISLRTDWFDLLAVQRTLKDLLQHHSSKA